MTTFKVILAFHIGCGAVALALGLVAMWATKQRGLHTLVGNAYHWVYVCLAVSACVLAIIEWHRIWWLAPIAIGSYALRLWATWPLKCAGPAGCNTTFPANSVPISL